jgi:hypothetical protein
MLSVLLVILVAILLLESVNTLTNNRVHILYREIGGNHYVIRSNLHLDKTLWFAGKLRRRIHVII